MPKAKESSKRKKGKKAKKDPNRPKRAMSSFMFFANDRRKDLRKEFPELKITEIGKKLGLLWKTLTPDDKKKYDGEALKDQERYQKAMQTYTPPSPSSSESDSDDEPKKRKAKKKKVKKDPNKPKRSMSSFMFFANAKRQEVREKFPELKITEIGKKLAEMWKIITETEKKKFEDLANVDKQRYKDAMVHYKPPTKEDSSSSDDSSSDSD